MLVGLVPSPTEEDSLDELSLLAQTAGAEVVDRLRQRRDSIRAGTFLSRGKLERLKELARSLITEGLPASRQIARLHRLIILLDSRRNMFFAPFAAILSAH